MLPPVFGRKLLVAVSFAILCVLAPESRADVGLVVETPTGLLGFLSNVGHVSVWISHGCLDSMGHIQFCENSAGLVLTSTAYWPNPGSAAIPAELFFLGTQAGSAGRDRTAWTRSLGSVYPDVQPAVGSKYLGRAWLRSLRVVKFATSAEEDRRVLAEIDAARGSYRYSYSVRNCAFYAQTILQRYFGPQFHGNRILELGIETPRAVERALQHRLKDEGREYQVIHFKGNLRHAWRQPSRNICESAIFDPKYAIPLLMYQPYLYAGFVGCYTAIRVATWTGTQHATLPRADPMLFAAAQPHEQRLQAFELVTGVSAWNAAGTLGASRKKLPDAEPDGEHKSVTLTGSEN